MKTVNTTDHSLNNIRRALKRIGETGRKIQQTHKETYVAMQHYLEFLKNQQIIDDFGMPVIVFDPAHPETQTTAGVLICIHGKTRSLVIYY